MVGLRGVSTCGELLVLSVVEAVESMFGSMYGNSTMDILAVCAVSPRSYDCSRTESVEIKVSIPTPAMPSVPMYISSVRISGSMKEKYTCFYACIQVFLAQCICYAGDLTYYRFMAKEVKIDGEWKEKLSDEFKKTYFKELTDFVRDEYKKTNIYPDPKNIFRAFDLCSFNDVKIVILGQDPYHGIGQANGLCFSVNSDVKPPPSLQNIFKELENDLGHKAGRDTDLSRWAEQGVLLLNATLTVRASSAGSHQGKGWEQFTDAVTKKLNEERENIVFILWGNYARKKGAHIDRDRHCVIESAHPSPFSAANGFFGSKPFSKANKYLEEHGKTSVEW